MGKASCLFLNLQLPGKFNSPVKAIWSISLFAGGCLASLKAAMKFLVYTTQDLPCTDFEILFVPLSLYFFTAFVLHKHQYILSTLQCMAAVSFTSHWLYRSFTQFLALLWASLAFLYELYYYYFVGITSDSVCFCPWYWHTLCLSLRHRPNSHRPKDKERWSRARTISLDFRICSLLQLWKPQ